MTTLAVIKEHIEITTGVCGGKPRIAGHRITVQNIVVWSEQMGMSPDEILLHYPSLNLSDIYASLAYYYDHREEIRQQIEDDENFALEIKKKTVFLIEQKLVKNGQINMTTKLTEIKEMIFQLPKEEINQLIKEVTEIMATKDFMELAETGFSEWNHPEEDIYNEKTVLNKAMEEAKLSPLLDAEDALKYQEAKIPKAGLHLGAISMAEDFDQPLPDSFWLGEE